MIKIKQVDAFTRIPFGGNPAGVVTEADSISDEIKQKIAMEMNLSETAFVSRSEVADFKVQFFTPRFEVDLCGHATIGTFSALYEEGRLDPTKTVFYQETKAGVLPVELARVHNEDIFMMTQNPPAFCPISLDSGEIAGLLGLKEEDLLDLPAMKTSTGLWWLVFGVKTLHCLMNAKPDLREIDRISREHGIVGVTCFCMETLDKKYSYHLRSFAPFAGVAEDPVCGTGNGCAASYIIQYGLIECRDTISLIGEQGNEIGRPGCVYVNISKVSDSIREVRVGGTAVTVLSGEMAY